jgi:hypothetical protein
VRDLGRDVVRDVGLADSVEDVRTDGTHEVSVNGSKGSTGESPLFGRVVGYHVSCVQDNIRQIAHEARGRCAGDM